MFRKHSIFSLAIFLLFFLSAQTVRAEVSAETFSIATSGEHDAVMAFFKNKKYSNLHCAVTWKTKKLYVWYEESPNGYSAILRTRDWNSARLQDVSDLVGQGDTVVLCGFSPRKSGDGFLWYFVKKK